MNLPSTFLFVVLVSALSSAIADQRPPELINWVVIESAYGPNLDAVEALVSIDDAADWQAEANRLDSLIAADPTIATLLTFSERFLHFQESRELILGGERLAGSCSSITGAFWNNDQMMVCKRRGEKTGLIKTLLYRRITGLDVESTYIDVEFDYGKLVERFDPTTVRKATTGSEDLAKQYDDYLLGTWFIEKRLTRTVDEERHQTGKLHVGPRLSFGNYAVHAEFVVDSSLRTEGSKFASPKCQMTKGSCQFDADVDGNLRIVNSKVRIVFDGAKWGTDVLTLSPDVMLGRNNNFGTTVRLKREAPALDN